MTRRMPAAFISAPTFTAGVMVGMTGHAFVRGQYAWGAFLLVVGFVLNFAGTMFIERCLDAARAEAE